MILIECQRHFAYMIHVPHKTLHLILFFILVISLFFSPVVFYSDFLFLKYCVIRKHHIIPYSLSNPKCIISKKRYILLSLFHIAHLLFYSFFYRSISGSFCNRNNGRYAFMNFMHRCRLLIKRSSKVKRRYLHAKQKQCPEM